MERFALGRASRFARVYAAPPVTRGAPSKNFEVEVGRADRSFRRFPGPPGPGGPQPEPRSGSQNGGVPKLPNLREFIGQIAAAGESSVMAEKVRALLSNPQLADQAKKDSEWASLVAGLEKPQSQMDATPRVTRVKEDVNDLSS